MSEIRLNIGNGAKLAGFINVGQSGEADLPCDIGQGLPFPDGSIGAINCDHFIEQLSQGQGAALLRECRRVLRPGGRLRIATPDLDAIVAGYVEDAWRARRAADEGWIRNRAEYLNTQLRRQERRWLYNREELTRLAEFSGLSGAAPSDEGQAAAAPGGMPALVLEFLKSEAALDPVPLVSIVIPAYKSTYFGEALDCALKQTYEPIEILVLDDSGGEEIVQAIAASGAAQRVRYLKNSPPLGETASLTRGIACANGQLIKPLHDDDRIAPDCVKALVGAFLGSPTASLASVRRNTINGRSEIVPPQPLCLVNGDCEVDGPSLAAFMLYARGNFVGPPSAVMFRRDHAMTITPYVMSFSGEIVYAAGDVAIYLNLLSRGDAVFLTETLSEWRAHDNHLSSNPAIHEQGRLSWDYMVRHGQRLGLLPDDPSVKIKRAL